MKIDIIFEYGSIMLMLLMQTVPDVILPVWIENTYFYVVPDWYKFVLLT